MIRLTETEALRLGLTKKNTKPIKPSVFSDAKKVNDPQTLLFLALQSELSVFGNDFVLSEVTGLIPGRKFRADIVIPKHRLVIEFDGFAYHRSKNAFQKDRERQNLFAIHNFRVLRFYCSQVLNDINSVVKTVLLAMNGDN
jgi:hypothetical protein